MIRTIGLCSTCYSKLHAKIHYANGTAVMVKECPAHGPQQALVDPSAPFVSLVYNRGTLGRNNTIIVHINPDCNMTCSWCYYPKGREQVRPFEHYHNLLQPYQPLGFNLLLSGGEPTIRPDFFDFITKAHLRGWYAATITNMLTMSDDAWFTESLKHPYIVEDARKLYKMSLSFQHPKNFSDQILDAKFHAIDNLQRAGIRAICCMFSIQSLDEVEWIRKFYDHTKSAYCSLRIRTMFRNWANKDYTGERIYLSALHDAVMANFADLSPAPSSAIESSNHYSLYLQLSDGMQVSLHSAPTVDNIDCHVCSRPVYMLALDGKCYSVPVAQIVNEGLDRGWYNGFELKYARDRQPQPEV